MTAVDDFSDLDEMMDVRGPYARSAEDYLAAGWSPVPVNDKTLLVSGFSGYKGRAVTRADAVGWFRKYPNANIAIRLPKDMMALDVDAYGTKPGSDTLDALIAKHGPLPATLVATARDLPSGKYLFRVPNGTRLKGAPGPGIETVQYHHRYVVAWPSIHHTGALVGWIDQRTGELSDIPDPDDIPDLPWPWLEALSVTGGTAPGDTASDAQVDLWLKKCTGTERPGWLRAVIERVQVDIVGNRHDTILVALCQVAREAAARAYPAQEAVDKLRELFDANDHGNADDFDANLAWAVGQLFTEDGRRRIEETKAKLKQPPPSFIDDLLPGEYGRNEGDEKGSGPEPFPASLPVIPDAFWTARPELEHIRQAARCRVVAPDAVLGAVLARAASYVDWRIVIPPHVSRVGSINVNIGLVGGSGMGKGSSLDTADDLIDDPNESHHIVRTVPAGSGEGMVRAFFTDKKVEGDDGKNRVMPVMSYQGLLIRVDEGEMFTALANRNSQTTLQVIRQAWSGEAIGASYASAEKNLQIAAHSYRWALVVGVQPELAGPLIDDTAGGTAQRMTWLATIDPGAPDEDVPWPGPLTWKPPRWDQCTPVMVKKQRRGALEIDEAIVAEMKMRQREKTRTGAASDTGHADLARLKLASLLAILNGRSDVTSVDWDLAGMLAETSDAVRRWIEKNMSTARVEKAKTGAIIAAKRNQVVANAGANTERMARWIWSKLADAPMTRGKLNKLASNRDRKYLDDALEHGLSLGWIEEDDGHFARGSSQPAEAAR